MEWETACVKNREKSGFYLNKAIFSVGFSIREAKPVI